mgnify:CR=1 FL=1
MEVEAQLALIRASMPLTYDEIRREAAGPRGRGTYGLVRRGLRGDANCFYACEGGHVVGAPFDQQNVNAEAALLMVQFGMGFLVMWPLIGEIDGTY